MADSLNDLARQLEQFAAERDWQQFHLPKNLDLALVVEAGEWLEHFQWLTETQSRAMPPEKLDAVAGEVADVLLYLVQMATALGIDPVAAAQAKLKLNARRYPVDRARGNSRSTTNCERPSPVIIYQASKRDFLHHALRDDTEDVVTRHYRSATGHGVSPAEVRAWKHSLLEMAKVLGDDEIPEDAGVAIEYQLPQRAKRIDFVITGEDADTRSKVIIVELKQWSASRRSEKDATRVGAPRRWRGRA